MLLGMTAALLLGGTFLFSTGPVSEFAYLVLNPSVRLTDRLIGSLLLTSDSGAMNAVSLVLAATLFNLAIYPFICFCLVKITRLLRQKS
jgi:hypothetical protein